MAVQLAKLRREEDPRQGPLYRPTPQPMAPQEKSAAQQMTDMAANRAMTATVDKGATFMNENVIAPAGEALTGMFSSAAPTAEAAITADASLLAGGIPAELTTGALSGSAATGAGTGLMATLGTAVPYIGAAMLAGKAFGLFNKGGHVGPLYASGGSGGRIVRPYRLSDKGKTLKSRDMSDYYLDNPKPLEIDNMRFGESFDYDDPDSDYYSQGGAVYANMGGLMPMLMDKAKEEGIPMGLASMLSSGSKGPISQVQYKSAGGEAYTVKYGGPLSAK